MDGPHHLCQVTLALSSCGSLRVWCTRWSWNLFSAFKSMAIMIFKLLYNTTTFQPWAEPHWTKSCWEDSWVRKKIWAWEEGKFHASLYNVYTDFLQLHIVCMDNASNCDTMASHLSTLIPAFHRTASHTRCLPHTINLIAKVCLWFLNIYSPPLMLCFVGVYIFFFLPNKAEEVTCGTCHQCKSPQEVWETNWSTSPRGNWW